MKTNFIFLLSLLISSQLFAQIPSGYYNSAEGLEGYTLKTALFNIIKDHNDQGYGALYSAYEDSDSDNYFENDGSVLDMYSENPTGTDPYYYTHGNNQCGNYSEEGDCYNREHLFPQGFFNEASPMKNDIHHVVPSDGYVNGQRGSFPFGEVGSASWTSMNGSKKGSCNFPGYSGTVFEPLDEFKGDIARCLLYFVTRYQNQLSGFQPHATNNPLDGSSDRSYEQWYVDLLISWHNQDPVSQREIDRNNAAYDFQGNRNPYIDHPEWVECVWYENCNTLEFISSPVTSAMVNVPYEYNISYEVTEETESIECTTQPAWLNFSGNTSNNTALLSGTPQQSDIGDHDVVITLSEDGNTVTQEFTITVSPYGVNQEILNVDFSDCPPIGWETISVSGNNVWECNSETYEINAYGSNVSCNDWFISPEIDLDAYEDELLSFRTWTKYTDAGISNPEVKLKYSKNYNGSPGNASWTELSYTYSPENSETWTSSGDVDLSSITGSNVHIAFHYLSSGTGANSSTYWKIDDILLTGNIVEGIEDISNQIRVSPNPFKDIIEISSDDFSIQSVKVYNGTGQSIYFKEYSRTNTAIADLGNFASGIYFIMITGKDNSKLLKKVIKE
jgi:endonuclease I